MTTDRKYYSVNLDSVKADMLRTFLKLSGFRYEASGYFAGMTHFEIYLTRDELDQVNSALDRIWAELG